ncbi:hypothetical protein GCM10017667_67820 [Streptomyces filamentosus]|uniref:Uncharacterized protein n=1 Tax=Streptomyces filamentosus TaxID=67294 RepID=A0A919ERA6_STRFL|nr:hypothetical protein GCM10017667_52330 [Streptomyces filamentosus]GHG22414.1 hypothetical protein GCM10017667_67820 [Streptomyces filamentosus]
MTAEEGKETGTCRARARLTGQAGACGRRRRGRVGTPRTAPSARNRRRAGPDANRQTRGRRSSHPEAKHHGGQTAAPGVMGSRTLLSRKIRIFTGGVVGPDKATAGPRNAALTPNNSTLTLE